MKLLKKKSMKKIKVKLHKNQFSIIELEAVSFEPDKVPDRLKDIPIQKPGSRKIK